MENTRIPCGYELVWAEDFSGTELDSSKWNIVAKMRDQVDHKCTAEPKNIRVEDGRLILSALREPDGTYTSNQSLTTQGRMLFTFGYVEIRAKVPFGPPAFPSFWMLSDDDHRRASYKTELDIFESFSSCNQVRATIHKWGDGKHFARNGKQYTFSSEEEAEQWHIYGMLWTPQKLHFLVDGKEFWSIGITDEEDIGDTGDRMLGFRDPMYLIFNNYIYTDSYKDGPGMEATEASHFPIHYYVDWVRLYQRPGEGVLITDFYG